MIIQSIKKKDHAQEIAWKKNNKNKFKKKKSQFSLKLCTTFAHCNF